MNRIRIVLAVSTLALLTPPARVALAARVSSRMTIPLLRVGSDDDVTARVEFRSAGDKSRFRIRVKNAAPSQQLTIVVGGVSRGTVTSDGGGNANVDFRTPQTSSSQRPLDFDPRGEAIEVADAATTQLSSVTDDGSNPPGSLLDERMALQATGAIPGAGGHARLRERQGRRDFTVEIEDVPDGPYDLLVGGIARATIVVSAGEGEVEFAAGSDDPDKLLLDFDPLGALIQVAQGSTIVLSATLLAPAPGVNVCTPSESSTPLANVGPDADASGDVRLRVRDDCRRDFRVEVEDLPMGAYDLVVGGTVRGTINVTAQPDGRIEGEIEFSSDPDSPDELPLTFDPTDATVDIRQGTTIFLSTTVGSVPPGGTCDPEDTEPPLVNSSVDGNAKGKARFRQETDCDRDFRVEIENVAVGNYELVVGGITRGTIVVMLVNGEEQGEIEFDNDPDQPGEILLDFDPRGQLIDVRQGATVFLSLTFPN